MPRKTAAAAFSGANLSAIFCRIENSGVVFERSAVKLKRTNSSFKFSICAALSPCSSVRIPKALRIFEIRCWGMPNSFAVL